MILTSRLIDNVNLLMTVGCIRKKRIYQNYESGSSDIE